MATIQDNKTPDTSSDTPASLEKGTAGPRRPSVGDGTVPENLREQDFRTRNGLNMKSFERRAYPKDIARISSAATNQEQVTGVPGSPNSIDP